MSGIVKSLDNGPDSDPADLPDIDDAHDLGGVPVGTETTIGWREWVSFPSWGIDALKAKIDTGARTSALHAADIEIFERSGETWVRFTAHPWQRSDDDAIVVETPMIDEREVTSSSGTTSSRPVVLALIDVDGTPHEVEVTLTRRDDMGFRMLLGREAMRGRYLVDPSRSYLTGRPSLEVRRRNRGKPPKRQVHS